MDLEIAPFPDNQHHDSVLASQTPRIIVGIPKCQILEMATGSVMICGILLQTSRSPQNVLNGTDATFRWC